MCSGKIYRNHSVFKQILTCTHVRTCWSDILGMENDYKVKLEKNDQTNEKIGNREIIPSITTA